MGGRRDFNEPGRMNFSSVWNRITLAIKDLPVRCGPNKITRVDSIVRIRAMVDFAS